MTTMIDKILYAIGSFVGHFVRQFNVYLSIGIIGLAIYLHATGDGKIVDYLFLIVLVVTLIFLKVDFISRWTSE